MIKAKKLKLQKFLLIGLIKKSGKHVSLKSSIVQSSIMLIIGQHRL